MKSVSNSIEIKGIVRNKTKIGVQDGQCDDLVNLKFKDGSWRVSADGKLITNKAGTAFNINPYTQLYVHTNVYHHLLGVTNNKLWWFANIDTDNETFLYLTDEEGEPNPIEICDVEGDVTIVQNGHLLTIISGNKSSIHYTIFKSAAKEYKELNVNPNGNKTDRELYPFGSVYLNLSKREDAYIEYTETFVDCSNGATDGAFDPNESKVNAEFTTSYCRDKTKTMFGEQTEKNVFTRPFLALVAVKLYDGSYMYASAPVLLNPNEYANEITSLVGYKSLGYQGITGHPTFDTSLSTVSQVSDNPYVCVPITKAGSQGKEYEYSVFVGGGTKNESYNKWLCNVYKAVNEPIYSVGAHFKEAQIPAVRQLFRLLGYNMVISLIGSDVLLDNADVFKSLCIFVTPQVDIFDLEEEGELSYKWISAYDFYQYYKPKDRTAEKISYDLINSPFFLLREYNINELKGMNNNSTEVDLSGYEYNGLLLNIVNQSRLDAEAFDRKDFFPKTAYQYNAKLHIANYQSNQFHGYPIDCFQLSNHNVKVQNGSYAVSGTLPNLADGLDVQYPREKLYFADKQGQEYIHKAKVAGSYFAMVKVDIETQQGLQRVVRYIAPYNADIFKNGDKANFVEELSALLTFPDYRAKDMEIRIAYMEDEQTISWVGGHFELKPHQYLNLAYYINPILKPISFHDDFLGFGSIHIDEFDDAAVNVDFIPYKEENDSEQYPNGLKVSMADNPFVFPNESTYQVGSSDIIALMSNAVAIGTGQTGAAPLYVFCKDGVYALVVDSSGEMTYSNARIIARDVCNNAKSVTPIDNGVVFSTDRGLMSISGNEVMELGASAEGDVFDITDTNDKAKKIMFNAFRMDKLGSLPSELLDNVDFLTYIKGAIINYDHNDRELMVSNPEYNYTYIMDRDGRWSRRDYHAVEYVNNYPTSYRVTKEGKLYKVDVEDNVRGKYYLLSNVIKLDSISFKQAYRLVVRGYFESNAFEQQIMPRGFDIEQGGAVSKIYSTIGCYVFGSYDGRQWSLIGYNERSGNFTDLGCNTAHTDVKYLRLCVAGNVTKNTRIDFIEISADGSVLNTKLR